MVLMTGPSSVTRVSSIINRTFESGGSVGGIKKAGHGMHLHMRVYNIGTSYEYRIPHSPLTIRDFLFKTTRNPTQYGRGSYTITHAGTLLG